MFSDYFSICLGLEEVGETLLLGHGGQQRCSSLCPFLPRWELRSELSPVHLLWRVANRQHPDTRWATDAAPEPRPEPPLGGHRWQGAQESMATQPQLSGEEAGFSIQTPTAPVTGCIALVGTPAPLDLGQTAVITLMGSVVETGDEIRHKTRLAKVRQQ